MQILFPAMRAHNIAEQRLIVAALQAVASWLPARRSSRQADPPASRPRRRRWRRRALPDRPLDNPGAAARGSTPPVAEPLMFSFPKALLHSGGRLSPDYTPKLSAAKLHSSHCNGLSITSTSPSAATWSIASSATPHPTELRSPTSSSLTPILRRHSDRLDWRSQLLRLPEEKLRERPYFTTTVVRF